MCPTDCVYCGKPPEGDMITGPYGLWHKPCHDHFFQPIYAATFRAFDEMTQRNRDYWLRPTADTGPQHSH